MAIAIRGTTPATNSNSGAPGTTLTVTLNGTRQPQAGDLLVIAHGNDFYLASDMATPTVGGSTTGVTLQATADAGSNFSHCKFYTFAVTSTGDVTVVEDETSSEDEERVLAVWVLSGADTSSPIDGTPSTGFSTSTTSTRVMSAITTSNTDSMLLAMITSGQTANGTGYTPPSSPWVEDADIDAGGVGFWFTVGHEQLSASGSTGTRTFTLAGGVATWAGVMLAVKTAGSATAGPPAIQNGQGGKTWRRRFRHRQILPTPPAAITPAQQDGPHYQTTQYGGFF